MRLIDSWGTGIPGIISECKKFGLFVWVYTFMIEIEYAVMANIFGVLAEIPIFRY